MARRPAAKGVRRGTGLFPAAVGAALQGRGASAVALRDAALDALEDAATRRAVTNQIEGVVPAADLADLYQYLTGGTRPRGYRPVATDDSVHSMFLSNPQGMLDALRDL